MMAMLMISKLMQELVMQIEKNATHDKLHIHSQGHLLSTNCKLLME